MFFQLSARRGISRGLGDRGGGPKFANRAELPDPPPEAELVGA
jgi:hypothetical protein